MTIDELMVSREYVPGVYTCLNFAAEAWTMLTGDRRLLAVHESDFQAGRVAAVFRHYRSVTGPTIEPSFVLMDSVNGDAHMGVCVRGRLLHITEKGPQFLLIEAVKPFYKNMRFYA